MGRRGLLAALAIFGLGFVALGFAALAQQPRIYTSEFDDLAIAGYDAVSYFAGEPVEGKPQFSLRYRSAVWRFANAANRDSFLQNPQAFMPAYGGHCAWTLASGAFVRGLPAAWEVRGGRLFLFYDARVKGFWDNEADRNIRFADENYAARSAPADPNEVPDPFDDRAR